MLLHSATNEKESYWEVWKIILKLINLSSEESEVKLSTDTSQQTMEVKFKQPEESFGR